MSRDNRMWGHDSFSYECWRKGYCLRDIKVSYNKKAVKKLDKIKLFRTDIIYYWKNNILYYKDILGEKKHSDQRKELYFKGTIIKDSLKTGFGKNPLVALNIGRPNYYGIRKEDNHFSKYSLEKQNIVDLSCLDEISLNPPIIQEPANEVKEDTNSVKSLGLGKMEFNIKDFTEEEHRAVLLKALPEAAAIIVRRNKNKNKDHRTDKTVILNTIQGHYAEYYLMKKIGLIDFPFKYHDLSSPNAKIIVEVKSRRKLQDLLSEKTRMEESTWNNSHFFIGFLVVGTRYILKYDCILNNISYKNPYEKDIFTDIETKKINDIIKKYSTINYLNELSKNFV